MCKKRHLHKGKYKIDVKVFRAAVNMYGEKHIFQMLNDVLYDLMPEHAKVKRPKDYVPEVKIVKWVLVNER